MKRKLLGLWLALVMLLAQMSFAHAASIEEMSTKITVREQELQETDSGTHLVSAEFRNTRTEYLYLKKGESMSSEAEGWSWDGEKQTLTLNGLNLDVADKPSAVILECSANIVLHGNNIIKSSYTNINDTYVTNGIYAMYGPLTIEGDGSLTVSGGVSRGDSNGIWVRGILKINSGTITAVGNISKSFSSHGIDAYKLEVNKGTLTATAGEGSSGSNGIHLDPGDLTINGGTLNASGGLVRNPSNQYGDAGIIISGSHEIKLSNNVSIEKPANGRVINVSVVPGSTADSHHRAMIGTQSGEAAKEIVIRESSEPNSVSPDSENSYIYDSIDPGANIVLPTEVLDKVTDSKSAADAVKQMTDSMTSEQKAAPTGTDLATLYAETAVSRAASKAVEGEIIISADSVADVEAAAKQATSAVETALLNGGVTTTRYLSKTVTLTTDETGEIAIKIDPDILTTEVDRIRVETHGYALTLKTADLAEDLTEILTIKAEEVGSGFAPGKANRKVTVKVTLPKGRTTNPVTISLPADKGATTYQAVVKTDGSATSSKYNPATTTMDGKVNTSGTYTVRTNEKSFTDISNKSAEMQKAILYLTSKGIINGTSATTFSPNGTINRQQVAALLMRALGKVDNAATAAFKDVSVQSSLYHEIASSKKHKIVNGYSDNTFRGTNVISRAQIVTVAGRVLTSEMNYKAPSNASTYLAKYSDTVPDFAKEMVALATRENLVVYRTDGTFSGGKNMTRGDAAIILYRLFQRIW